MQVKDLINKLQALDPEAEINLEAPYYHPGGKTFLVWDLADVHQLGSAGQPSNLVVMTAGTHAGDALIHKPMDSTSV